MKTQLCNNKAETSKQRVAGSSPAGIATLTTTQSLKNFRLSNHGNKHVLVHESAQKGGRNRPDVGKFSGSDQKTVWTDMVRWLWKSKVWKKILAAERTEKNGKLADTFTIMCEEMFRVWAESLEEQYRRGLSDGQLRSGK